MKGGISIIICCYNSANRLPETLKHIANQIFSENLDWEVVLVDNNSFDNTRKIATDEWSKYNLKANLKIVNELKQGLSYARETGVKASKYDLLIFCDDDNWLDKNYLNFAYNIMIKDDNIAALGGQGLPVCEIEPPEWFNENMRDYAIGKQAEISGDVTERRYVWGAGMVLRRENYLKCLDLGFKTYLKGRNGKIMTAGDDTEMCYWFILLGFKIWYDERLIYHHFIPKERLEKAYFDKMWEGFYAAAFWQQKYVWLIQVKGLQRSYLRNVRTAIKCIILRTNIDRTYLQFLLGPIFIVSSISDYKFIFRYFKTLYSNNR